MRYGIKRKGGGREQYLRVEDGIAKWTTDHKRAALWNSPIKAGNVMAAQCQANDLAEVFSVADEEDDSEAAKA